MVVKCEIKFDNNPNGIYFAGQTLSGTVELTFDKPKKLRGLILKIEGFAKVHWTERERRSRFQSGQNHHATNQKIVNYNGREDYLNSVTYLIGGPEGNQIEVEPGTYQYNFQSVLPPLLPTSFEAKHGHIRYLVNVVIDRPWKFDLTYKLAFTVIKQLDLNYENPALRIPTKVEKIDTFFCGFCKTAPVYMAASIPMSGFVPGQNIPVCIEINNESRIAIDDVKVSLKKLVCYHSQTPKMKTKEEIISVKEIRSGEVRKRSKGKFDQRFAIPPLPPSNTNYCRVINVSYEIHVTAKVSGLHVNPVLKLPITLGTVPLSSPQNNLNVSQQSSSTPSPTGNLLTFSDILHPQSNTQETNRELPPPSYHEAMGSAVQLNEEGEHSMGTRTFNPMYPVYSFETNQMMESTTTLNHELPPGSVSDSAIIQKY
ncbi:CLUMA_CG012194, isoform A [Clunio marinus]|uniref:CLUMA_CG012194, isoform A n=1 Tax=Clunio marinus TaxID=568069 RepID=A0A1J1IGC8_9DIPT|nr:CLUMA_CG012194, isoform A [Clunio marinus]